MSREPWSDERLHDAYAALVDRPTPAGLEEDVMSELRDRPERGTRRWWRPIAVLPAAAVLVAVGVVAVVVWSGPSAPVASLPPVTGASPSAEASASPGASPSPDGSPASAFPAQVLGLPVITVSRLLDLTDEGTHAGEVLAVGGWFTPAPRISCPQAFPMALLELGTCEGLAWLRDQPTGTAVSCPSGTGCIATAGSINPKFIEGSTWAPEPAAVEGLLPIPVVFLGHVGDERAALCPTDTRATCERQFVVDRVAWADGEEVPLRLSLDSSAFTPLGSLPTVADAERYANAVFPGSTVLSVAWLTAPTIQRVEPTRDYTGAGRLLVVRVIGPVECGGAFGRRAEYHWSEPLFFTLDGARALQRSCR